MRSIVSYVRRSEKLNDRLARAWAQYSSRYLLDLGQAEGSLTVAEDLCCDIAMVRSVWGRDTPLIVEIGSGQGENVVASAREHPDRNYLALEVYQPGLAHTMLMAGKSDLDNLRLAQVNAPDFLSRMDPELIKEVWTFFPDPWPKMKHHKRRLVQPALAEDLAKCLVPGGIWRIATDIEDYALHVHEVMDGNPKFRNLGTLPVSLPTQHVGKGTADQAKSLPHAMFMESERFEGRIVTNFERKGIQAGRVIHDLTYQVSADRPQSAHKREA